MGGEFWISIVYGFEVNDIYVQLRGYKDVNIGSKSRFGFPIYYCISLTEKNTDIDILSFHDIISKLDKDDLEKMKEFDLFAKKYGYTPSWQLCCVGDFEVKLASNSKEETIERLCELQNDIIEMYNENDTYSIETIESIEIVLLEENIGFMVKDAIKTPNIESIIKMVNDFYSLEN